MQGFNYYRDVYLKTPHWQCIRQETIELYNGRCWKCGTTKERLQCHHLVYRDKDGSSILGKEVPGVHVVPVCRNCHQHLHRED